MYRIPNIVATLSSPWATLRNGPGKQPAVFLTIDDGPVPENTPLILDKLRSHNVPASFFLVGEKVEMYPSLTHEIRKHGHALHSHGYTHVHNKELSLNEFTHSVNQAASLIGSTVYRPPYGKIPIRYARWLNKNGYKLMLWNVDVRDYRNRPPEPHVIDGFLQKIQPGDIVLLHDKPECVHTTPIFIDHIVRVLRGKGITFSVF